MAHTGHVPRLPLHPSGRMPGGNLRSRGNLAQRAIVLNATTGRLGRILAELRDLQNQALPGYELEQARVYAVRVDADSVCSFVAERNLAGDYIPDRRF